MPVLGGNKAVKKIVGGAIIPEKVGNSEGFLPICFRPIKKTGSIKNEDKNSKR